jgi:ABC-2 type transport system permease protein
MPATATALAPSAAASGRPAARPAFRAEWIKVRTIHSAPCTLLAAAAVIIGVTALVTEGNLKGSTSGLDPISVSLAGVVAGEYLFAAFGALAVTEYSSGTMAVTFCAMPQRIRVLLAKLGVVAAVAATWAAVVCLGSFTLGQSILATRGLQASLSDPHVTQALAEGVLLLTLIALLGVALATVVRRTAGVLIALFVLLYLAVPLAALLPVGDIWTYLAWLLPAFATAQAMSSKPMSAYALHVHAPGPVSGPLTFAVEIAVATAAAAIVLRSRSA